MIISAHAKSKFNGAGDLKIRAGDGMIGARRKARGWLHGPLKMNIPTKRLSMRNSSTARPAPQVIPFPRRAQPKADFPFTMIPNWIMADTSLTPGARLLFGAIFTSCRRGRCYAGNEALADRSGLSVIQVRRQLAILEGRGLIVRDLNGKSRAEIRVPVPCIKKMQGADHPDTRACIEMTQNHASNRCTELESGEENLEDGSPRDGEEIDPWTRRWFGAPPANGECREQHQNS